MKFVVDVEISIQVGFVQDLTTYIFNEKFSVNSFQLINRDTFNEAYHINIVYSNQKLFDKTVNKIKLDPRCLEIKVTNRLEQKIAKGLLKTESTLDFDNDEEYETNHKGAYLLLETLIRSTPDYNEIYYHTSVCSISGVPVKEGRLNQQALELAYIENEQSASIISKFTKINSTPLVTSYTSVEDFSKTIESVQNSYSLYHINPIKDEDDPDIYQEITSQLTIPFFTYATHEKPILLLSGIYYCLKKFKLDLSNTNLGIIGLDASAVRLTGLLKREECLRVLGFDDNEKSMMNFESKGGLATTKKNILENCDIVLILRDQVEDEDIQKIRPGLLVIPYIEITNYELLKKNRSVKFTLDYYNFDTSRIRPGIAQSLLNTKQETLTDDNLRAIAHKLVEKGDDIKIFPALFSSIHQDIEELLVQSQQTDLTNKDE